MQKLEVVRPLHLSRSAVVYIRQSTEHQVLNNLESGRLQHAMRERVQTLGWADSQIRTVESDTGKTGSSLSGRVAYQQLLADVADGQIGVVVSYESARLSRNCSDWYPLLDACAMAQCLIADRDGVYDPATTNGRLLLGMKGILSEIELHTLQGRLLAGLRNKANRGELKLLLPAGLEHIDGSLVVKDPDISVCKAVQLVFEQFMQEKTVNAVARKMKRNGLRIPCRQPNGDIVWRDPDRARVTTMLTNPAYAGAFVYGRTKQSTSSSGKKVSHRKRDISTWDIVVKDRYPAYISWQTFEQIQMRIRDNYAEYLRRNSRGVTRDGSALLAGIISCGECGHKMHVQYKRQCRYVCNYHQLNKPDRRICQNLHADVIDKEIVEHFFQALSPCELDAHDAAIQVHQRSHTEIRQQRQRQIERHRYETTLARRRYERVDPDNRLVASELEHRWEQTLVALKDAEEQFKQFDGEQRKVITLCFPKKLRDSYLTLGQSLPKLWKSKTLKDAQKKALLRCLIECVILKRLPDRFEQVRATIVWCGGLTTDVDITVPVNSLKKLSYYPQMKQHVSDLLKVGLSDSQIARALNEKGFCSTANQPIAAYLVKRIRLKNGWHRAPSTLPPRTLPKTLSASKMEKRIGVNRGWIYERIKRGVIQVKYNTQTRSYLFPDTVEMVEELRKLRDGLLDLVSCSEGVSR